MNNPKPTAQHCTHRWALVQAEVWSDDRLHLNFECFYDGCPAIGRQAWGIATGSNGIPYLFEKRLPDPNKDFEEHFISVSSCLEQ